MIRLLLAVLALTGLLLSACGQESPQPQTRPAGKSAVESAPPVAAPLPATQVTPAASPTPAPPSAPAASAPPAKAVTATVPPQMPTAPAAKPASPSVPAKSEAGKPSVPDSFALPASQGQVTFHHLAHAKMVPCATCHGDGTPGKIGLSKETAHALCRDCHKAKGAGPTACGGCHQK